MNLGCTFLRAESFLPEFTMVNWLNNLSAMRRLLLCLGGALAVMILLVLTGSEWLSAMMAAWDIFCLLMIAVNWITFYTVPQKELSHKARQEDESRYTIFALVLGLICVSLAGILLLLKNSDNNQIGAEVHKAVSLMGVALSWGLLHTLFTLRYAHLYYSDDADAPSPHTGGLDFPEDEAPDYLDFAYFSFVVGMTFQVSDVEVRSKLIRRVVLLHGFLSFVFNTAIVALSISILSNSAK